jgi:ribonucleoside-diphosphate reductase alpha chain
MNSYQQLIAKSRYARYLPEEKRRENWDETSARWVSFFQEQLKDKVNKDDSIWGLLGNSINNLAVLPSMRSIMTAGEALRRTHVAAYNCSYLPVDNQRCFDEAMYILLCGTGVGFSCEQAYVNQLPVVPTMVEATGYTIVVADSKEGWCEAYKMLIGMLYEGIIPKWDVSLVRPAGAPLKTFGGRASGPGPLIDLFQYTVDKFKAAQGRKLKSIEAHDIMCKIGEVVVVGGVRRSAMISLGDLGDYDHATAKAGAWWENHGERALANNSAVYNSKPSIGEFMKEWLDIYNSHSGERGIFNREASQVQAAKWGRRDPKVDYGTNPCSEIILKPYQFCNLSTIVVSPEDTVESLKTKVRLATIMGTMQSTLTDFPYLRDVWRTNTNQERLLGVSMTGILDNPYLRGSTHYPLRDLLEELRDVARETNKEWAAILGVPESAAITCVKPEGTVSQLTQTSSGIHAGHAKYYIRRIRQDKKDPLTQFLISQGIPNEDCVMKPDQTTVFSFPQHSPGFTREDLTAIEHLNIWLTYQRYWCEHKPSVTISVKDHEWMEVGAWVYEHFNECTGISFLPDDGGTYRQAPYENIDLSVYHRLKDTLPVINWDLFYEDRDNVEGVQTLSCTAGGCEI